ncbi:MAG: recombinase family protein, partial [Oscillospiraceae bacterium]|nr:recombinase family protein [Oscillospiraceae bacterium]
YHTVAAILTNEVYLGNLVQGKYGSISYKTRQCAPKPKEQWIRVEGTHEPIIDKALWNRVQKKVSTHARPLTPTGMVHPFSGIVVCKYCGYAVRPHKTHGHYYLMCNTRQISEDACPGAFIPAEELEQIVISELRSFNTRLLDLNKLEREIEFEKTLNNRKAKIQSELRGYQEKIDEYTKALQTLYVDKSKGLINIRDYHEMADAFQNEKKRFEGLVKACQDRIDEMNARTINGDHRTELLSKYMHMDHLTRSMTEVLIDHIEIGKRDKETGEVPVSIFWNF